MYISANKNLSGRKTGHSVLSGNPGEIMDVALS